MSDIVKRLRQAADVWGDDDGWLMYTEAADQIELLAGKIASLENYIEMAHKRDSAEIERLRAELAQQRGEPVAWQLLNTGTFRKRLPKTAVAAHWTPLYAAPPPPAVCSGCGKADADGWALYCVSCIESKIAPQRQPLQDAQIEAFWRQVCKDERLHRTSELVRAIARAVEAYHQIGIKETK